MSQNGATILRNVFQFATILNQASNAEVQKWDGESLSNALDWADYCQELYMCLKEKPLEKELNSHLAQMTMMLQPVSCLFLTLDSLQHAKHLLINTLMCNPHVSKPLNEKLRVVLAEQPGGSEILSQIQHQFSTLRAAEDLHASLWKLSHGEENTKGNNFAFQANFLLEHLMKVVGCSKKKDRFESYCHALCDKLIKSREGNDIFVSMFQHTVEEMEPNRVQWFQLVLDNLMSWLQQFTGPDWSNSPLIKAEVRTVTSAAVVHPPLFSLYLDILTTWADSCVPEVHAGGCLVWSSPDGSDSRALTRHFLSLLSSLSTSESDQGKRNQALTLISDRVQEGQFTVWRQLASHLVQLLKQGQG